MDLGISGRTALVLGGSKGIGRQIALDFADQGVDTIHVSCGQDAVGDTVAAVHSITGIPGSPDS